MNNLEWKYLKKAIPPVINIKPFVIKETFLLKDTTPYVWEYPMATELAQYKLHKSIKLGKNINRKEKAIDTYLAIPWGRFDAVKFFFPLELIDFLKRKIKELNSIATQHGFVLKIHTVTQKENWKMFIPLFEEIGVTDVHAVQYEEFFVHEFNPFKQQKITFHSCPFQAINAEDPKRNTGLKYIQPSERKYLASFKGAHMRHYKSDVRVLLKDSYEKQTNKQDIFVDLLSEWFYNKDLFSQFYQNCTQQEKEQHIKFNQEHTKIYNETLSNSLFTLCPEGGGINSIRFWEALSVGSIPVLIISKPDIPMMLSLHPDLYKCCYIVFRHNIYTMFEMLRKKAMDVAMINQMSNLGMHVYKQIRNRTTFENQYAKKDTIFSAFL